MCLLDDLLLDCGLAAQQNIESKVTAALALAVLHGHDSSLEQGRTTLESFKSRCTQCLRGMLVRTWLIKFMNSKQWWSAGFCQFRRRGRHMAKLSHHNQCKSTRTVMGRQLHWSLVLEKPVRTMPSPYMPHACMQRCIHWTPEYEISRLM